jgi:phosphate ABC transporter permease protein PstC
MEAHRVTKTTALLRPNPASRLLDNSVRYGVTALALASVGIIAFFFLRLYVESQPVFAREGFFAFSLGSHWEVSRAIYGALPLVAGTVITSVIALVIGVPVAVCTALYITELCPRRIRAVLVMLTDLLAAIPSVVYGLWGVFVVIPALRPAEIWFSNTFGFLPFVKSPVPGPNYFIAGLILAIMIIPIVSSISREVLDTVPTSQREAAVALGATRWEVMRRAVLSHARTGITGAAMLGLGRAIGETIAATMVIGNAPAIGKSLFDQGYTLAAVIANEFGEAASDPLHRGALIAAGLLLFLLTLFVNGLARYFVARSEHRAAGLGVVA